MHTSLIETYRIIYRAYRIDTAPVWYQEEILGRRSTVSGNVLTYVASAMLASALEVERLEEAEDTATLEEDHPLFSLLSQRSQGGYHDAPLAPASQSEPQQPFTIHTNLTYSQRRLAAAFRGVSAPSGQPLQIRTNIPRGDDTGTEEETLFERNLAQRARVLGQRPSAADAGAYHPTEPVQQATRATEVAPHISTRTGEPQLLSGGGPVLQVAQENLMGNTAQEASGLPSATGANEAVTATRNSVLLSASDIPGAVTQSVIPVETETGQTPRSRPPVRSNSSPNLTINTSQVTRGTSELDLEKLRSAQRQHVNSLRITFSVDDYLIDFLKRVERAMTRAPALTEEMRAELVVTMLSKPVRDRLVGRQAIVHPNSVEEVVNCLKTEFQPRPDQLLITLRSLSMAATQTATQFVAEALTDLRSEPDCSAQGTGRSDDNLHARNTKLHCALPKAVGHAPYVSLPSHHAGMGRSTNNGQGIRFPSSVD